MVYVGSDSGFIYAINAASGALVWSYNFTATDWGANNYIRGCPAIAGGVVYVAVMGDTIFALNATTAQNYGN